ncbi:MAG TPA: YaiI/YqxD family protein [Steroidobacteraceae bacterium]
MAECGWRIRIAGPELPLQCPLLGAQLMTGAGPLSVIVKRRRAAPYIVVSQANCEIGASVATASIWVDADACPKVIKEILFRAAERTGVTVTLVANQPLAIPRLPSLRVLQVASGFDVADSEIVKRAVPGDLVITADVPLAAQIIANGGEALNPRGERYSPDTIRSVLTMRDFMDTMRASGHVGGGPPALTQADRNAFASHLDKWLARSAKR